MLLAAGLMTGSATAMAQYTLPGTYDLVIQDNYGPGGELGEKTITVTIEGNGKGYTMKEVGGDYFLTPINFNFDADTNTLTFAPYSVGTLKGASGDVSFTAYNTNRWYDEFTYGIDVTALFNPETGQIKGTYIGFCWLPTDQIDWNYPDFIAKYDFMSAQQTSSEIVSGEAQPEWKDLGDATLMDGWVLPMLGIDQTLPQNQWKVPLQQNIANPNLYRLVDPYHVAGTAAAEANLSSNVGYIEFDVSDPEHVVFNKVEAGFAYQDPSDGEKKFNEFYCMNFLGYFHLQYPGMTLEQLTSALYSGLMCYTTFENNIVSLGYKDFGDGDIAYDAHYGTEYKPVCNGYWSYEENYKNYPVNMTACIIFPDALVEDPDIDDPKEDDDSETNEFTGSVEGVHIQNMGQGDVEYPYSFNYNIVYNDDKTLTFTAEYIWKEGEPVSADKRLFVTIEGIWSDTNGTQGQPLSTNVTFEPGQQLSLLFETPVAMANVQTKVSYIVGTSTGIDTVAAETSAVRYFNLQGLEVKNPQNGIFLRVQGNKAVKVIR